MAGEQILVVEDNELNMKLFRDVLVVKGYRALEATTGGELRENYTTGGVELLQALKAHAESKVG
jgi:CheY-like chemotaxis protein